MSDSSPLPLPRQVWLMIYLLCAVIGLLSFKPSEPYLSMYLICPYDTQVDTCHDKSTNDCNYDNGCMYSESNCGVVPCYNVTYSQCGNDNYDYCIQSDNNQCDDTYCYFHFSENQVNNEIYPWSTYAYLPFLLLLGPFAEIFSYRIAIIIGIIGRIITRFLLLYGTSLVDMQLMQVTYAMGTAAEDVFSAYIYYLLPSSYYYEATGYIKASALICTCVSGILGDLLVTQDHTSVKVLLIISAAFVCAGGLVGFLVIKQKSSSNNTYLQQNYDTEKANDISPFLIIKELPTQSKLSIFMLQLQCLYKALESYKLIIFTIYWVIGNCVYTTLYGYEVSIYLDLTGSNDWNGSVLAIMLLAGSFGATLPTLVGVNKWDNNSVSYVLVFMALSSSISLLLMVKIWETVPTLLLFTIFFFAWQFINVLYYAHLATHLKNAQIIIQNNSSINDNEDAPTTPEPPYSVAIVSVVATSVVLQVISQSIIFSFLQLNIKSASYVYTFLFIAATILYILGLYAC